MSQRHITNFFKTTSIDCGNKGDCGSNSGPENQNTASSKKRKSDIEGSPSSGHKILKNARKKSSSLPVPESVRNKSEKRTFRVQVQDDSCSEISADEENYLELEKSDEDLDVTVKTAKSKGSKMLSSSESDSDYDHSKNNSKETSVHVKKKENTFSTKWKMIQRSVSLL